MHDDKYESPIVTFKDFEYIWLIHKMMSIFSFHNNFFFVFILRPPHAIYIHLFFFLNVPLLTFTQQQQRKKNEKQWQLSI